MGEPLHLTSLMMAVLAGVSNFMGGLAITSRENWNKTILAMCLAVSAGFMLALSIIKLLPLAFEHSPNAALFLLAGYFIVHFFEHMLSSHFHFGEETHEAEVLRPAVGWTAFTGLAIHAFFDGMAMASGFAINFSLGLIIFVALLLHKIPEGFTVSTVFIASGRSRASALAAAGLLGVATLVGFLGTTHFTNHVGAALSLAAGATLYVAASDLIPVVNEYAGVRMSLCVFLGVCGYYLVDLFLKRFGF